MRPFTGDQPEIRIDGGTVGEVLENFKNRFPDAAVRFFSLRTARYFSLYLNGKDIRGLEGVDTPVRDGDELAIVFAVAGG